MNKAITKLLDFGRDNPRLVTVIVYSGTVMLPRLVAAVLTIILTQVLTVQEYGIYGIYNSILSVTFIIADMGVSFAVLRYLCDRLSEPALALKYISSVVTGTAIATGCLMPILGVSLYLLWGVLGLVGQSTVGIVIVLAVSYLDRSVELYAAICRALEKPSYYALGYFVNCVVMILSAVVLVWVLRYGIVGVLLSFVLSKLATVLTFLWLLRRSYGVRYGRPSWRDIRECFGFGLPLVPNRLAGWGKEIALRPMLAQLLSLTAVGYFSLATSISSLTWILMLPINLALAPVYYKRREVPGFQEKLYIIIEGYLIAAFVIWSTFILFCDEIVRVVAGTHYSGAVAVTAIIFLATFFRAHQSFFSQQIMYLKKTWIFSATMIPGAIISMAVTFVFAKKYGVVAAGLGVLVSDALITLALFLGILYYEKVHYPVVTSSFLTIVLCGITYWAVMWGYDPRYGDSLFATKVVVVGATVLVGALLMWPKRHKMRAIFLK